MAVHERADGWPWNLKLHGPHDAEVAETLGTGWFLNVGPTGIRAQITRDNPKYFTVRYVFRNSPVNGKIKIDDVIVGANGKVMNVAHYFGRGSRGRGTWDGPMVEMSKLIEDSQAKDGNIEFIVWPGGDKSKQTTVTVQVPAIGRFSPTWPYHCERSDKLMLELCEFLYDEHKRQGNFGRPHTSNAAVLALMASNQPKYERLAFDIVRSYANKQYDPLNGTGFPVWGWGHEGILLGEYYLLTKDRRVLPAIESLVKAFVDGQTPESGGFSHRPSPFIMRRQASGGPKGYGAMALTGGLAMTAMSIFKEAGLDYGAVAHEQLNQAFIRSVDGGGGIGYGFSGLEHAVITLTGPNAKNSNSPRGIGFEIQSGMRNIGTYDINWPTKSDPRYKPTDWLEKEIETNRVFDFGEAKRLVIRTMPVAPPNRRYEHNGRRVDHLARSGTGALAHSIGNAGDPSWEFLAHHMATGCARSPESLLDGHASTHMHVIWGSLGAALADEKDFRNYMEGIKWWFIMAHTHNGGFVVMPGRDYASTDHVYGNRVFPTGCAATILALKERRLQVTGAARGAVAGPSDTSASSRRARFLAEERVKLLDQALVFTLANMTHASELKELPMDLSKAHSKVVFTGVDPDWKLRFRAPQGQASAAFALDDLELADRTMLARLIASLRSEDAEAQAMAGLYMELSGQTDLADAYYNRSGDTFAPVIERIFE
ncbi:MAG: DUF6288 domain-containing protein [Luteolibacter sp.]